MSNDLKTRILADFAETKPDAVETKCILRELVQELWPELPKTSDLDRPHINEYPTATAGCGIAIVFEQDNVLYTALAQAGDHYSPRGTCYMIPGGFINLKRTEGSQKVNPSDRPESAFITAVREAEEEVTGAKADPILSIDPDRPKLMDTKTLGFESGEVRIVIGMVVELEGSEINTLKSHVYKMNMDDAYTHHATKHSVNKDSGLPEIAGMQIFKVDDVANGHVALYHRDQQSLYIKIRAAYNAGLDFRGDHFMPRI